MTVFLPQSVVRHLLRHDWLLPDTCRHKVYLGENKQHEEKKSSCPRVFMSDALTGLVSGCVGESSEKAPWRSWFGIRPRRKHGSVEYEWKQPRLRGRRPCWWIIDEILKCKLKDPSCGNGPVTGRTNDKWGAEEMESHKGVLRVQDQVQDVHLVLSSTLAGNVWKGSDLSKLHDESSPSCH